MIAALLTRPYDPLELEEIHWNPVGYGQVSVQVLCTGICGAQLQEIDGQKGEHFPRLLGHEAAVRVLSCGPGVKHIKAGDMAVAHWRVGNGIESESPRFVLGHEQYTSGQVTTFLQQSVVSENRLTKVPEGTPVELCSLLGCALSTAFGTIENEADLKFGERILVMGCGGLGLNLVLAARLRQASYIGAVDISPDKAAMAAQMGATRFCQPEEMLGAFEDDSFDVVIDTTGDKDAIERALRYISPSGRFILVGQPKPRENITISNARHLFGGSGKTILATQGGRFNPSLDVPRYVAMHAAGLLDLSGLITHRFPLLQINDAIECVRHGHAGRVLIDCQ